MIIGLRNVQNRYRPSLVLSNRPLGSLTCFSYIIKVIIVKFVVIAGLSHIQELRQNLSNLRVDRKSRSYRTYKKKANLSPESGNVNYIAATPGQMDAIRIKIDGLKRRRRVTTVLVLAILFILALFAYGEFKDEFNKYKPYNGRRHAADPKTEKKQIEPVWDTKSPTYHVIIKRD